MTSRDAKWLLVLAAVAVACSSSDAEGWRKFPGLTGPTGGVSNTPGTCELTFSDPTCNGCMGNICRGSCVDCQNDSECYAIVECTSKCGSSWDCVESCVDSHQGGEYVYAAWLNGTSGCMATQCASACGIDTSVCQLVTKIATCDSCINSRCLDICQTCAGSVDCMRVLQCITGCNQNQTCTSSCVSSYPEGWPKLEALIGNEGCMMTQCSQECSD